jgi:cytosine deaminase
MELSACFDMVTTHPAELMNLTDYGIAVGNPADLVVLDCPDAAAGVAELAQPIFGVKRGRRSFTRPASILHRPD